MTSSANMQQLRDVLRPLALHESDFAAGDAVVKRIAALKIAIDAFEASAEPWLLEWLGDEHYKGAVLYAAGKTNGTTNSKAREASLTDRCGRVSSHASVSWVDQLATRLIQYEEGRRDAASVAGWRSELTLFKQDPRRND